METPRATFSEASLREMLAGASIVGGGFVINWQAPVSGTAILVEENSRRIILTRSVAAGDTFEFDPEPTEQADVKQQLEALLGVPPEKAHLLLFFRPDPEI